MLILTSVLLATVIILVLYCYKTIKDEIISLYYLWKLPGPPINDVITGNLLPLYAPPETVFKTLREFSRTYYPVYKLNAIHIGAANIFTPEDCEIILSNPIHMEKSLIYNMLHDWLGTGLLTSTGQKWQSRRKILTPAFHFSILRQFITIFNEETEKLVEILKSESHQPYINISSHIAQFTLKTITETAMGTKLEFTSHKEQIYKKSVLDMGKLMIYRLLRAWFLYKFIYFFNYRYHFEKKVTRRLHQFTESVILERERNFQEVVPEENGEFSGKQKLAMLDLLLTAKMKDNIDDEGIREEVDTFMFEGHDTTAVALGFALMLIAAHRNVQDLIVQEMLEVLGDLKKKPSYNDLQEMRYLERVLKEVLRLYPSVHFISRKLGDDVILKSGFKLGKGSVVNLHLFDLHHSPEIYPDPEKFDPDRFLPENIAKRHPFAYLPFSAGSRNCIGRKFAMLELKAAVCGILGNFILEPVDLPTTVVLVVDLVLRTKNGIRVKFVPRD